MDDYYVVDCPCRFTDRHFHKIPKISVPSFLVTGLHSNLSGAFLEKTEKTDKAEVEIFYYTCGKSNHSCKSWVDTESGKQLKGECEACHPTRRERKTHDE